MPCLPQSMVVCELRLCFVMLYFMLMRLEIFETKVRRGGVKHFSAKLLYQHGTSCLWNQGIFDHSLSCTVSDLFCS